MIAPNKSIVQGRVASVTAGVAHIEVATTRAAWPRAQDLAADHVGGVLAVRLPTGTKIEVGATVEVECSLEPGAGGPEFVASGIR